MSYPTRKIGDVDVSAIGFGAMGISAFYGAVKPDEERFKVILSYFTRGREILISSYIRFLTLRFSMAAIFGIRPTSMVIVKNLSENGAFMTYL